MKARSNLEQTCDPPPEQHASLCWLRDAAQHFEQRALSGSIAANDADCLAVFDLEANIPERPEFLDFIALNDLSPVNKIECLARKRAEFASDDVPKRRVLETRLLARPVPNQVAFG